MKILIVIACHTNTELKAQCLQSNIKYFKEISDQIVIVNSTEVLDDGRLLERSINDNDINFIYYDNSSFLGHGKWHKYLNENDYAGYDGIVLTNDSFLVINSLVPFITKFKTEEIDALSLIGNREKKYHHQDFLRVYKKDKIKTLLEYYESRFASGLEKDKESFKSICDYAIDTEINSTFLFKNVACLYDLDLRFKENINFHDNLLELCIRDLAYPILKIKKITEVVTKYDSFPDDFDPAGYISMHEDLSDMSEEEATKHFTKYGLKEGRMYKSGQKRYIPEYITKAVKQEGINYE